jgi:Uma2 family endonuclease
MSLAQKVKRYTPQEYYALEREAAYKSDYYNGEIFAMSGGMSRHSLISANITGEMRQRLKGKPCAAYASNQRLKAKATGFRCYPDVSIYCGKLEYDPEDSQSETAINPTVVFEVLSKSSERYDRGFKARNYRRIESLAAYILVSQTAAEVEVYTRDEDGDWKLHEINGLDSSVHIPGVDLMLPMGEIYDRVELGAAEAEDAEEEGQVGG